ncbi:MAG: hypothetical protein ABSB35_08515 [Bryobacteraceae bacterium]
MINEFANTMGGVSELGHVTPRGRFAILALNLHRGPKTRGIRPYNVVAAMAQGAFAGIQFGYNGGNHAFFNANTGDVWEYGDHGNFRNHYKVRELGKDHGR